MFYSVDIFHFILLDEHARYLTKDQIAVKGATIPPIGDIPISEVNKALY